MKKARCLLPILGVSILVLSVSGQEVPKHFFNKPENINPDPNYTPGDYPVPDSFTAKVVYQSKKSELINADTAADAKEAVTLGVGEISFNTVKNETASVLGYFKEYVGLAEMTQKGPKRLELLVDINSLDTAVPGRNYRIMKIFFDSVMPDKGHSHVVFDRFQFKGDWPKNIMEWKDHPAIDVTAFGNITLNGVEQKLKTVLTIKKQKKTWVVETKTPIDLRISDFSFGNRVYDLLKECNHKSLGNTVQVNTRLFLR